METGQADDFEMALYERSKNPQAEANAQALRREVGQTRRRLRRLASRAKHEQHE